MLKKIFSIFTFIFLITSLSAESIPVLPASYYGTINVEGGGTLNNVKLIAMINGEERGSITIQNNKFGGASYSEEKLVIEGNQEDDGKTVEFYIGDYKAKETISWKSGDIQELSLTFPNEVLNENDDTDRDTTTPITGSDDTNTRCGTNIEHSQTTQTNQLEYTDVAGDIKSEKIKEIIHNAKLIIGSKVDEKLSACELKNNSENIKQALDINEDCILIGGPIANPLSNRYLDKFEIKISNDYPGKNKGVIQKQIINGHTVILLAGSDRWGTKAAVEYFKTLDDIPNEPIFVQWNNNNAIKIEK